MPEAMRPELYELIVCYQGHVSKACRLLREKFRLCPDADLLQSWLDGQVPDRGWLDQTQSISFRFHGIGCRVMFGQVCVDFDFLPGGRHDGFDTWRLFCFAETVPDFHKFGDFDKLSAELDSLHETGALIYGTDRLGSNLSIFADSRNATGSPSRTDQNMAYDLWVHYPRPADDAREARLCEIAARHGGRRRGDWNRDMPECFAEDSTASDIWRTFEFSDVDAAIRARQDLRERGETADRISWIGD